jgi:hypothetical protein
MEVQMQVGMQVGMEACKKGCIHHFLVFQVCTIGTALSC